MLRSVLCLTILGFVTVARADDWPQWMGPTRDNVWHEGGLVETLPVQAKILWKSPVAGGYSGPSVAQDKVFVSDFVTSDNVKVDNFKREKSSGKERLLCLDEKSGNVLWSWEHPETYSISYPAGPRSTPLVHDGKVYFHGAEGQLACLRVADGKLIWEKSLKDTYHTKAALWGYASQPLIDGVKLIVIAGGEGSHCVALNKDTGVEIWRTGSASEQGYVPPVIIEQAHVRQLILVSPDAVYSVDPETGKQLWSQDYKADNGSIIMTPLLAGNYLFEGGFNNKNLLLELATDRPQAKTVWRDLPKKAMAPINVQPFAIGTKVYGFDQSGEFRCIELPSGNILWSTPQPLGDRRVNSGTVFMVRQGDTDRFWLFTENGDLIIGQLTPKAFTEISRTHVLEPTNNAFGRQVVWCAPAFANKRMYVRNDKEIVVVDLAR